jgi:tetratricopeptide (TPR) repeat protein
MTSDLWNAVWERVRSGGHAVMIGPGTLPPPPSDLKVIRVSCDTPGSSGGPLDAARRKVVQLLGEELLFSGPTPSQLEAGLRRRLFGDLPGPALEAQLVEACNRLADHTAGRSVLAFEGIDAADEPTVESLIQILQRSGWLRLQLVLTVRGRPQGRVAELLNLIRQTGQNGGITEMGVDISAPEAPTPFAWESLPPDVVRVLRAGAVCGATFEADLVARLLDEPLASVLERLQAAADVGAPLIDRGEARFSLPPDAVEGLRSRILPSLLNFWHARLGELLSRAPLREGRAAPPWSGESTPQGESAPGFPEATPTHREERVDMPTAEAQAPRPLANYAELFDPRQRPEPPHQPAQEPTRPTTGGDLSPPAVPSWLKTEGTAPPSSAPADQARAAVHLQAAGHTEAAVEQYLAAVREAASQGDVRRAYSLTAQALHLLDGLPTSPRRALLRTQLLIERAGLQWHGALAGAPFTLEEALRSIEAARSSLPDEVPANIAAQLAATTAGICYELGDAESLEGALAELTDASRRLLAAGEPLIAASLLNDQAAVYVRLGDPVRATHLLEESRKVFEGRLRAQPNEAVAVAELAETHHLLARLPLHAPIRPGREADAYAMSLEHLRAAEQAYQHLGQRLALARVWETMGRIELQRGQPAAAQEHLSAALMLQRQLGDVIGLARSTAALADMYSSTGRLGQALSLLANSITLNFEKGTLVGLAMNRRALEGFIHAVAQAQGPEAERLQSAVAEVERSLDQAESVLGRVELPRAEGSRF